LKLRSTIFSTKELHLLILCTFSRFGEMGFGESGLNLLYSFTHMATAGVKGLSSVPNAVLVLILYYFISYITNSVATCLYRGSSCLWSYLEISVRCHSGYTDCKDFIRCIYTVFRKKHPLTFSFITPWSGQVRFIFSIAE